MIYLGLSVLFSAAIFIVFRFFSRFGINNSQAITFNYVIATILGFAIFADGYTFSDLPSRPWLYLGVIEGVLFIAVFMLFAISSQRAGVGITAIASKMSVVIPVVFGVMVFSEAMGFQKSTGILLALVAFYLSLIRKKGNITRLRFIILPVLLFLGNGTVDTLLKTAGHYYLTNDHGFFLASIFLTALLIGTSVTIFRLIFRNEKILLRNILGGFILGILNYFTTYFTLLALRFIDSSIYFPIYNSGIVIITALTGMVLFGEKYTATNYIGILLTIIAIVLISG